MAVDEDEVVEPQKALIGLLDSVPLARRSQDVPDRASDHRPRDETMRGLDKIEEFAGENPSAEGKQFGDDDVRAHGTKSFQEKIAAGREVILAHRASVRVEQRPKVGAHR